MFEKPFREKLASKGWEVTLREGGNPSQTKNRIFERVAIFLADMRLLYEKLPQKERDELFNTKTFENLFDRLLSDKEINNTTKLDLAIYFISKSLNIFERKTFEQHQYTQALTDAINAPLEKSLEICKDILYVEKINQAKFEKPRSKYKYLCTWSEILGREKVRLKQFIETLIQSESDKFDINYSNEQFNHRDKIVGIMENKQGERFKIHLSLNKEKDEAFIGMEKPGRYVNLICLLEHKNYDFLLYYKESDIKIYESRKLPF